MEKNQQPFIVKVQRIYSISIVNPRMIPLKMIVNDKDNKIHFEGNITEEIDDLFLMGQNKKFFYAEMRGTIIQLLDSAPWQPW